MRCPLQVRKKKRDKCHIYLRFSYIALIFGPHLYINLQLETVRQEPNISTVVYLCSILTRSFYLYVLLTVHFSNIWFLVCNLMHLLYLFIFLCMFRAILCSSSRGSTAYTQHLVLYVSLFLCDRSVHRQRLLTACAPNGHTRRVTHKEPDAVYMQ